MDLPCRNRARSGHLRKGAGLNCRSVAGYESEVNFHLHRQRALSRQIVVLADIAGHTHVGECHFLLFHLRCTDVEEMKSHGEAEEGLAGLAPPVSASPGCPPLPPGNDLEVFGVVFRDVGLAGHVVRRLEFHQRLP